MTVYFQKHLSSNKEIIWFILSRKIIKTPKFKKLNLTIFPFVDEKGARSDSGSDDDSDDDENTEQVINS